MSDGRWKTPEWLPSICDVLGLDIHELSDLEYKTLTKLVAAGLLLTPARKQYNDGVVADFRNERRQLRNDLARLRAENVPPSLDKFSPESKLTQTPNKHGKSAGNGEDCEVEPEQEAGDE